METPRKFIIATINLRGVSTSLTSKQKRALLLYQAGQATQDIFGKSNQFAKVCRSTTQMSRSSQHRRQSTRKVS